MKVDYSHMSFLGPLVTLTSFRNELDEMLRTYGLDNSLTQEGPKWANFVKLYGEVIRDCPLRIVGENLKHMDSVQVIVSDVSPDTATRFRFIRQVRLGVYVEGLPAEAGLLAVFLLIRRHSPRLSGNCPDESKARIDIFEKGLTVHAVV